MSRTKNASAAVSRNTRKAAQITAKAAGRTWAFFKAVAKDAKDGAKQGWKDAKSNS